jgi:putative oxidoreductase
MDEGVLLIRVVLGLTLAAHGYQKVFKGGRIPGTARWFDSMGMKPNGKIHAWMAALTEIGAGLLMAVGLLTPLAAAGFVGLMVVAAWTSHRENGFFIVKNGWEYNLILAVVAVGVAMIGAGKYSLDDVLDLSFDTWVAFALSAVLGVVAGVGLLVACYRPPAPAPAADAAPSTT